MTVGIEELKQSLRIDGTADDELLTGYLTAAASYVKSAIGNEVEGFYGSTEVVNLYNTAVLALASTYWTYRTALTSVAATPIDLTVDAIIGQLRGLYDQQLSLSEVNTDDESN